MKTNGNDRDKRVPLAFASDGWVLYEDDVMEDEGFAIAAVERWKWDVERWLAEHPADFRDVDLREKFRAVALIGAELLAKALCEGPEVRRQLARLAGRVEPSIQGK